MIDRLFRQFIEAIKESRTIKIELVNKELTMLINGDKQFAHDVALAYQSLLLRKIKGGEL